jgi:DNA (cytosine-5)-methyltransferase 1
MKFIDLFAGIGGFRRGLELAGHQCVGFCEIDKYAVASYTSMHLITDEQRAYLATLDFKERQQEIMKEEYRNGEWYADDIRTVPARDIPVADIWCFGFPCQDISVAGKQVGFYGNRSSLFFRVMYLLGQTEEEKRPAYLLIENVKNLLSVNGGWDFARLLSEMDKNGYDAEWQVLNSKDFGVPQNRERCFIVGHLRGHSGPAIFPVEGTNGTDSLHVIKRIGHANSFRRYMQTYDTSGICETMDTGGGGGHNVYIAHELGDDGDPGIVSIGKSDVNRHSSMDIHYPTGLMQCLDTLHEPKRVAIPVLTPARAEKRQMGRRFKEDGDEAFTVTAQDLHGVAVEVLPEGYEDEDGE